MLSNKWTFSLTSLVVMLALVFVAPSAMADPFAVTLSVATGVDDDVSPDISGVSGDVEVVAGADAGVNIRIATGLVVNLLATNDQVAAYDGTDLSRNLFTVTAFNSYGGTVDAPDLAEILHHPAATPNGKSFSMQLPAPTGTGVNAVTMVVVSLKKDLISVAHPTVPDVAADRLNAASNALTIHYVEADISPPTVYSIRRLSDSLLPVTAATENVIILLSEKPKAFTKDHVDVTNATWIDPVALVAIPEDPDGPDNEEDGEGNTADNMPSTGRDDMLYPYVLEITPKYENKNDIVVKVKAFEDMVLPVALKYTVPARETGYMEGRSKLTIMVGKEVLKAGTAGYEVVLAKELFIPADGYLVVADDEASSAITNPGGAKDAPPVTRPPAAQKYNLYGIALPNLESFLTNGGVIDVVSPMSLTISEIMWGSDASIADDNSKSQWIELVNSGAGANTLDDDAATAADEATRLIFYGYGEAPALNADGTLPTGVKDRVGTIDAAGAIWSLAGKGQRGRSGAGEEALQLAATVPIQPIISMYRMAGADGTLAASWMVSSPPAVNFKLDAVGVRIASPGAAPIVTVAAQAAADATAKAKSDAAAAAAAKAADTSVSMPQVGQIYISEIMFAGGGTLPQWIEISNGSRSEQVNLSGWTLTVENATADTDVSVGAKAVFTIPEGTKIDSSGQNDTPSTILVVTEQGRNNIDDGAKGAGQILNLWTAQQTELILLGVTKRRYSLLSDMAFQITIAPPTPKAVTPAATETPAAKATRLAAEAVASNARKAVTDVVGNLGTAGTATWALPMDEGARSSIIRRHVPVSIGAAAPEAGEMMDSWALASDTAFADVTHIRASSYYGSADDVGTPGFRAGGALPVELSHFRPARNKDTGAVVITWSTQSELNNAGFFIKRSQQRDGEFQIINATMIAGAGTTSEKQFYTYQDTTAQPNVVYYYQIEDVSLDGNHQTLTRGIRLKGHIGAAGKATVLWGDLKTQE